MEFDSFLPSQERPISDDRVKALASLVNLDVKAAVHAALNSYEDSGVHERAMHKHSFETPAALEKHIRDRIVALIVEDAILWSTLTGKYVTDPQMLATVSLLSVTEWMEHSTRNIDDIVRSQLRKVMPARVIPKNELPAAIDFARQLELSKEDSSAKIAELYLASYQPEETEQIRKLREKLGPLVMSAAETRHRVNNLLHLQSLGLSPKFDRGVNLEAEPITDIALAQELLDRHQSVNRAVDIASAIIAWKNGDGEPLQKIKSIVANLGGFLQQYTLQMMQERIADPMHWVMFRTKGQAIVDKTMSKLGELRYGADIQVHLTDDAPDGQPYFTPPDPEKGDVFKDGKEIARCIRENPAISGCVSDIVAEDDVAHAAFASTARAAAFAHIRDVINPTRKTPVRFIIAETFKITGLRLQSGEIITLNTPLENLASHFMHLRSERNSAWMAWERMGDEIEVPMPGDDPNLPPTKILTNWDVLYHDLYPHLPLPTSPQEQIDPTPPPETSSEGAST